MTNGTDTSRGTIRPLVEGDIPLIDSWWEQGGTAKSSTIIARALQNDRRHPTDEQRLCLGITLEESEPNTGRTTTDTDDDDKNHGTHHTTLIACIVRYETGAVGLLHVQNNFRNRGYGSLLLREATRRMIRHHNGTKEKKKNKAMEETTNNNDDDNNDNDNTAVFEACIRDGNAISEAVFTNCGWILADPTLKTKGTGTRRSNRKWIYPYKADTKLHCNTPLSE